MMDQEWQEAQYNNKPGHARRWHRQPFSWTTIYQFVPETGYEVLVSSTLINLGYTRPEKLQTAINHTHYFAIVNGAYGFARPCPEHRRRFKDHPVALWDFLDTTGFAAIIDDFKLTILRKCEKRRKTLESETLTPEKRPPACTPPNPEKKCSNDKGFSGAISGFSVSPGFRTCPVCEKRFKPLRKTRIACSPRCRNRLWRKKQNGKAL
jgi:hypothetical protein